MIAQNDRAGGGGAIVAAIVGLAVMVGGCRTTASLHQVTGLPSGVYAVGGGLLINWKAPVEGTVYLVDKTSGKIVETKSLDEGEVYEFEIDPGEGTSTFEKAVGTRLSEARLVLFFRPGRGPTN